MIFHSRVTDFSKNETDSGLSIKTVLKGCEEYKIGNVRHRIREGNFLLVNEHQQFDCRVHAPSEVEGMCIYLDPDVVREVHLGALKGHRGMLDQGGSTVSTPLGFLEKIYRIDENCLGSYLAQFMPALRNPNAHMQVDFDEFFLGLSEHLVASQKEVRQLIGQLALERPSTREEIFRRVSLARNFIEAHFLDDVSLDEIAEVACLSKYHFLRCFKQVYGKSPYQYVLQRRLQKGKELLIAGQLKLTEIAYRTGFADRRAFNKAFKKAFGIRPAEYRAQH